MSTTPQRIALALALVSASIAFAAMADTAKPTAAQIAKARGECALQKQRVKAMEAKGDDDQKISAARLDWEHACGRAHALISAASGVADPVPSPAAAPAPAAAASAPAPAPEPVQQGPALPAD